MLARKVVTRRGRHFRGYFPSAKLRQMVPWESLLERDAILLFEFSPGVVSYKAQPTVVHFTDGVQIREYYPDFELVLDCGSVVDVEIKPADRLANPRVADKFRAIAGHYAKKQQDFRILTDLEIRREPLFTNLRGLAYLLGRSGHVLPTAEDLQRHFMTAPKCFQDAAALFGRDTTMRLLTAGRLVFDLETKLSDETLISLPRGGHHATLLF